MGCKLVPEVLVAQEIGGVGCDCFAYKFIKLVSYSPSTCSSACVYVWKIHANFIPYRSM